MHHSFEFSAVVKVVVNAQLTCTATCGHQKCSNDTKLQTAPYLKFWIAASFTDRWKYEAKLCELSGYCFAIMRLVGGTMAKALEFCIMSTPVGPKSLPFFQRTEDFLVCSKRGAADIGNEVSLIPVCALRARETDHKKTPTSSGS